jgi:hypothetical protein
MENQQLVSTSRQCSSTPVGFFKDFLAKNNVTTLEHPPAHTLLTWLQMIFTCSLE